MTGVREGACRAEHRGRHQVECVVAVDVVRIARDEGAVSVQRHRQGHEPLDRCVDERGEHDGEGSAGCCPSLERALDDGCNDLFLVLEVPLDRACGQPWALADEVHRRALIAAFTDDRPRHERRGCRRLITRQRRVALSPLYVVCLYGTSVEAYGPSRPTRGNPREGRAEWAEWCRDLAAASRLLQPGGPRRNERQRDAKASVASPYVAHSARHSRSDVPLVLH